MVLKESLARGTHTHTDVCLAYLDFKISSQVLQSDAVIETLQIYTLKTMQMTLIEIEPGFPTKFNQSPLLIWPAVLSVESEHLIHVSHV